MGRSNVSRQDKEGQQQAAQTLDTELQWLEGHFDSLGPYFLGTEFSLVDISLLPFFLRLDVLQQYRGYSLPSVRAARPLSSDSLGPCRNKLASLYLHSKVCLRLCRIGGVNERVAFCYQHCFFHVKDSSREGLSSGPHEEIHHFCVSTKQHLIPSIL